MAITAHQSGALGVPMKVHTQKSTGTPVTASMDAYEKLEELRAEAKHTRRPARQDTISHEDMQHLLAGLELRAEEIADRVDRGKAELESIKETLDPRIAKLTALIPHTKEGASEITHITKGQYRKVWGREPKANILTKDGKRVRWEYALDEIAQELHLEDKAQAEGVAPDEYVKELIEDARGTKAMMAATEAELASDERTLKALDRLKAGLKQREGDRTTGTMVRTVASAEPKGRTKPERKAKAMAKDVARALIEKTQRGRTDQAIAMDNALLAKRVVPISQAAKWAKRPNRFDIRGVDTPRKGIAYQDRKGKRLSRRPHRGWKRVKYTWKP